VRTKPYATSVLIFDEVELLDVTGPIAVLSAAGRQWNFQPFKIDLIAHSLGPIATRSGLSLSATRTPAANDEVECLIIPGGYGARKLVEDAGMLDWVRQAADRAEFVLLLGNGALIAAAAGLLDGVELAVTPELLPELGGAGRANPQAEVCVSGKVLSAARSALGLDLACELVARTFGKKLASSLSTALGVAWSGELGALEIISGPLPVLPGGALPQK
jgi:transcriptional regulator GlxA family with amidase domain